MRKKKKTLKLHCVHLRKTYIRRLYKKNKEKTLEFNPPKV